MLYCSRLGNVAGLLGCVAVLGVGTACPAQAETIVSSLNNTSSVVNFSIGGWAGSSFTTDARSWTLTSATVTLELGAELSSTANVRLFADNAGRPGASLADLGTKTITTGSQMYDFTTPTAVTLAPSTRYWIAVGNVGTNGGLNVSLSQQGGSFTNFAVPGASMVNSISTGGGVGTTPPTNWFAAAAGTALLFAVEGNTGSSTNGPTLTLSIIDPLTAFVSWPTNFTGFTLQSNTNLVGGTWTSFTNAPPILRDGQFAHQINPATGRQFFRLQGQ